MASRVIYSHEFMDEVENGTVVPENFDDFVLCEGDSWMDRSSLVQMSMPWALAATTSSMRRWIRRPDKAS